MHRNLLWHGDGTGIMCGQMAQRGFMPHTHTLPHTARQVRISAGAGIHQPLASSMLSGMGGMSLEPFSWEAKQHQEVEKCTRTRAVKRRADCQQRGGR